MKARALLLTGAPGVGKTTAVRKVSQELRACRLRGFTTKEIREEGTRVGFRLETFENESAVLARLSIRSPHRVSEYGVDVDALDGIVASALRPSARTDLYLIDEIGKMECFSERFMIAVEELLDSRRLLVATVAQRGGGFIEEVKRRPDVELWTVTRRSRDEMPDRVLKWLRSRGVG